MLLVFFLNSKYSEESVNYIIFFNASVKVFYKNFLLFM